MTAEHGARFAASTAIVAAAISGWHSSRRGAKPSRPSAASSAERNESGAGDE
jgi:hypothetical protein